uniref:Uncharacterized protein n=1 Tax=Phlebotomus papatasi TaxID=29031 RepID=A0A1B0GM36_PHLPP
MPSGVLNISSCRYGSPVFVSFPHFYAADPFYLDQVEGINPSKDKHQFYLTIEPSAAETVRWQSYVEQKKVSLGLSLYNEELHVTKTAREFLFDGYEDDLIEMAKEMSAFSSDIVVPFDRAGYFYMRNNSASLMGHYNMYTGADDISKIGSIGNWNYGNRTKFFADTCGMVNGSAGEFYPPQLKKDQVSFFSPDMCRTLPFDFEAEVEVEGITGYKYSGGARTIDKFMVNARDSATIKNISLPMQQY